MPFTNTLKKQSRPSALPLELSIVAFGSARLTMADLAAVRKDSISDLPTALSPQLLRHSDEQTLAGLVATTNAIRSGMMAERNFENWAIVCSSRNLGRSAFASVIDKYQAEGPWGVSVQVIPHCTAHAVAATVSLALGSHGPCIGAGSAQAGESDAFISAASILRQANWDSAWVLFSGWSPELAIDPAGRPISESSCWAIAVAITRRKATSPIGRICIGMQTDLSECRKADASPAGLSEFFCRTNGAQRSWLSTLSNSPRIRVDLGPVQAA